MTSQDRQLRRHLMLAVLLKLLALAVLGAWLARAPRVAPDAVAMGRHLASPAAGGAPGATPVDAGLPATAPSGPRGAHP